MSHRLRSPFRLPYPVLVRRAARRELRANQDELMIQLRLLSSTGLPADQIAVARLRVVGAAMARAQAIQRAATAHQSPTPRPWTLDDIC